MRYILVIAIFLFITSSYVNAQKFSVGGGLGLGQIINEKAEGRAVKGLVFAQVSYHLNDKFSVGIELGTAGNFSPVEDNNVMVGNSIILSPYDTKSNTVMGKFYYSFKLRKLDAYGATGIGTNRYFTNVNLPDIDVVERTNFAVMPEVGLRIDGLSISARYLIGGRGPAFQGVDERGDNYSLSSENMNILYVTLGYNFTF
ncbi:MAG: outer membrane beta-barrel protein [Bacteroidota bacterium]